VVVVPEGGELCRCGNRGCLETVASTQALIKRVQSLSTQSTSGHLPKSPQEISLDTIEQAFLSGDPIVREAVLETGRYMGMAISSLVGTLNIRRIVLTGDMTRFGRPWLEAIQGVIYQATLSRLAKETQIEIGQWETTSSWEPRQCWQAIIHCFSNLGNCAGEKMVTHNCEMEIP
jgi:predicted NBD/HSP70 family sugar kinase